VGRNAANAKGGRVIRNLIKRMGLQVGGIGRGATQEPASLPEAAPVLAPPVQPVAPPRRRTCLIVDDSRVVRGVSRNIIEGLGYRVFEAENGEEALNRCRADMPDLILLDWDMPVMTGLQFITQLRKLEATRRAKAVFCTSRKDTHDIFKGIEAGADEYVTKPFTEITLKEKLERIGAL
jgi:two-component system, chemotaxis family, chemotaxis protein CheY